jgi:DNA polymerase-1
LHLLKRGIHARGFRDDVSLYSFLLDADPGGAALETMVERRLDLRAGPRADERALYIHELNEMLRPEIDRRGLRSLYEDIELPLSDVLARMEHTGIRVDPDELARLSALLDTDIRRLTAEIHELAGREFNIASPQQLGKVLFEEMGLPAPVRYGKGKTISTAADVLENLAPEYPIVRKALDYRQLTKLKGTYVDVLPSLIDPDTGRVHTSFNQAGAATGRLSSSNPNLQHIPIRTELGREIRAAFLPREGWDLVVADYSQIELRLLAHMSGDPVLVDAFRKGEDIHTRTAAEVMGVPPMLVTKEARNNAKAVNFGIVYGISSFGLAANLGISKKEADLYIRSYFERYAGVRRFIDETIAKTRETGVARTLFGRERPIPDMNSRNSTARGFAERTAVNSPIQGTAADLIKLAMVRIDRAIAGWQSKLLVQVHDELVLESPPEESQRIRELVKREMESVCDLTVPLVVEVGAGKNWRDAK